MMTIVLNAGPTTQQLSSYLTYSNASGCTQIWLLAITDTSGNVFTGLGLQISGTILTGEVTNVSSLGEYTFKIRMDLDPYDREYSNSFIVRVACSLAAPNIPTTIHSLEVGVTA
jgi:hypothetical protein